MGVKRPNYAPMKSSPDASVNFEVTPLRYSWFWLGLGVLFILVVTIASLIDLKPVKDMLVQDKLMHVLTYGFLMGWFSQIYKPHFARFLLAVSLIVLGVGIEFMQGLVAFRQFEVLDMLANAVGVIIAWALSYTWMGNILLWCESLLED